ncbi:hypothetical protein EU528_12915 [Candidatus Thorarchaeota archaeon]|nr:MAG: hypothetical protein EU528_12915 [Candidatus Thorarchaeota archaeon]
MSSRIISPTGPGLSVKLFHFEVNRLTPAQLESKLSSVQYTPPTKDTPSEGFASVESKARKVRAEFTISYRVPVRYYEGNEVKKNYYMSVEKGMVLVDFGKKIVEIRGSDRIARRFRRFIYSEFSENAPSLLPVDLVESKSAKKFYASIIKASELKSKENTNILYAVYSNITAQSLRRADFRGDYLQNKKEVTVYGTMHGGTIALFSGTITYPSNTPLKTVVNCESGSLFIYKTEDGILEKDARWLIDEMITAATE